MATVIGVAVLCLGVYIDLSVTNTAMVEGCTFVAIFRYAKNSTTSCIVSIIYILSSLLVCVCVGGGGGSRGCGVGKGGGCGFGRGQQVWGWDGVWVWKGVWDWEGVCVGKGAGVSGIGKGAGVSGIGKGAEGWDWEGGRGEWGAHTCSLGS